MPSHLGGKQGTPVCKSVLFIRDVKKSNEKTLWYNAQRDIAENSSVDVQHCKSQSMVPLLSNMKIKQQMKLNP